MNYGPLEYAAYLRRKRDKQREALVYEAIAERGPDESSRAGELRHTISVSIMPVSLPLVLVLSADHEVSWQIAIAPGADLCAVLLSGMGQSSVSGAGPAQVSFIGGSGSVERDPAALQILENEVLHRLGLRIGRFRSLRGGRSFEIGAD